MACHLLLLQNTRVQFPEPTSGRSQEPRTLVPEDLKPLSGLHGHCTHVYPLFPHIYTTLKNYIHAIANFLNEKELGLVTKTFKLSC